VTTPGNRGTWHVLTCEYPPGVGGLASYCGRVVQELTSRGERVHVWTRGENGAGAGNATVHASPERWTISDLRRVGRELDALPAPRRLFVQWVPHGFGYKSLNLAFAAWVARRASKGDRVEVMVHEPWLQFAWRAPRQSAAALVHRLMMRLVLGNAQRVWVSIQAWQAMLRPYARRSSVRWLPVPSLVPVVTDRAAVRQIHAAHAAAGEVIVGHFGTFGPLITGLLGPTLETVLDHDRRVTVMLLGRGSDAYRESFERRRPDLAGRVVAQGTTTDRALSLHFQACDLLLQPYPDGVSTRRSSTTSLLAHGCALVTTHGRLTDALWHESGAVDLVPPTPVDLAAAVLRLIGDEGRRASLGGAARELHERVFGVERTVDALLELGSDTVAA
jgi:glycosyltransferase involved in cell wall biosynthesis